MSLLANDAPTGRTVDSFYDRAWSGMRDSLRAKVNTFSPNNPIPMTEVQVQRGALAERCLERFTGDNLNYLKEAYNDQWRECSVRLRRLDEPTSPEQEQTLREGLTELGFAPELERIEEMHVAYSRALGIGEEWPKVETLHGRWLSMADRFFKGFEFFHGESEPIKDLVVKPFETALEVSIAQRRERRLGPEPQTGPLS